MRRNRAFVIGVLHRPISAALVEISRMTRFRPNITLFSLVCTRGDSNRPGCSSAYLDSEEDRAVAVRLADLRGRGGGQYKGVFQRETRAHG